MFTSAKRPRLTVPAQQEPGAFLVVVGAVLLFVSLFLSWYQPGRSAWTVFEVWDLVLAAVSVAAIVAAAGRLGLARPRPDSWLILASGIAFVVVVASLINHPPAAIGLAPMGGIWLALGASILMAIGTAISVARVSVAIKLADRPVTARRSGGGPVSASPTPGSEGAQAADRHEDAAGSKETGTDETRVLPDRDVTGSETPPDRP